MFGDYTPLSSSSELVRRMLSPLNALNLQRQLTRSGQAVRDQAIDLAHERFVAYVRMITPLCRRRGVHALLVFVPPWQDAAVAGIARGEIPRCWSCRPRAASILSTRQSS